MDIVSFVLWVSFIKTILILEIMLNMFIISTNKIRRYLKSYLTKLADQ